MNKLQENLEKLLKIFETKNRFSVPIDSVDFPRDKSEYQKYMKNDNDVVLYKAFIRVEKRVYTELSGDEKYTLFFHWDDDGWRKEGEGCNWLKGCENYIYRFKDGKYISRLEKERENDADWIEELTNKIILNGQRTE